MLLNRTRNGRAAKSLLLNGLRGVGKTVQLNETNHRLSERQVLDYLIYLRDEQKLAAATVNQALVSIRILYRDVLGRDWNIWKDFHLQRREPLPTVLTRKELLSRPLQPVNK